MSDDLDETARLILMELPGCSLLEFARTLCAEMNRYVTPDEIDELWTKYRGFDGRRAPTHDVRTGAWR